MLLNLNKKESTAPPFATEEERERDPGIKVRPSCVWHGERLPSFLFVWCFFCGAGKSDRSGRNRDQGSTTKSN